MGHSGHDIMARFVGQTEASFATLWRLQSLPDCARPERSFADTPSIWFYRFEIDTKDLVIVRPRKASAIQAAPNINIPSWAEDKAREIAREKGWDFHVLKSN